VKRLADLDRAFRERRLTAEEFVRRRAKVPTRAIGVLLETDLGSR
jgi:hypothetical protein